MLRRNSQIARHRRMLLDRLNERFKILKTLLVFNIMKRSLHVKNTKYYGAVRLLEKRNTSLKKQTMSCWLDYTASSILNRFQWNKAVEFNTATTCRKEFAY